MAGPPPCPPGWTVGPPDFVGVGAQRSGTTWWYRLIVRHPDVVADRGDKERHFFESFCNETPSAEELTTYDRLFPRPPHALRGEWTPRYMFDPWTPPLLARAAPRAKLLVLLRDPIERYRSGLALAVNQGRPVTETVHNLSLARGLYLQQLERLLRYFDRERLLVLQYERCARDTVAELRTTYAFLELNAIAPPRDVLAQRPNLSEAKPALTPELEQELRRTYVPEVAALVEHFPEIDLDLWPNFGDRQSP